MAAATIVAGALGAPATAAASTDESSRAKLVAALDLGAGATDIAFWGDTAVVALLGNGGSREDGFAVVDISNPREPRLVRRFACTGAHRDISIWRDLVFVSSWAQGSESADCASAPAPAGDPGAFAGIRIISIRDPKEPRVVRRGGHGLWRQPHPHPHPGSRARNASGGRRVEPRVLRRAANGRRLPADHRRAAP